MWSVRPELPPVPWGAGLKRKYRAAKAQGRTDIGWFAHEPTAAQDPSDGDAGRQR